MSALRLALAMVLSVALPFTATAAAVSDGCGAAETHQSSEPLQAMDHLMHGMDPSLNSKDAGKASGDDCNCAYAQCATSTGGAIAAASFPAMLFEWAGQPRRYGAPADTATAHHLATSDLPV